MPRSAPRRKQADDRRSPVCHAAEVVLMDRTETKAPSEPQFLPYRPERLDPEQAFQRGEAFLEDMDGRRSVRHFSDEPVPRRLIETAIRAASTAPSGAHKQPWTFVAVSDPDIKREIRIAAECEEYQSYEGGRMPAQWKDDLKPMGTNWQKPFLETVPWLVVVFEQTYGIDPEGNRLKHYYVKESVGLACGLFITALHRMGLATLTHTPSPMTFLRTILGRPNHERPYILFPIGYPASDAQVPALTRKPLEQVAIWFDRDDSEG